MKTNVILVEKSLGYLDGHACPTPISHFLHKIYSNALLLGEVILVCNRNLYINKLFYDQSFIIMGMTWNF